jgi:hypothetical protein
MKIVDLQTQAEWLLYIVADDGRQGVFDVGPYLEDEAFQALRDPAEFARVTNGGYYVEWACGADLSADTIEARWRSGDHPRVPSRLTPAGDGVKLP